MKTIIAGLSIFILLLTVQQKAGAQELTVPKDSLTISTKVEKKVLSPKKASIYAALFPGLGQIYNGKYWKLPVVYGGYAGLIYIFGWNNNNYKDYFEAYRTIAQYSSATQMNEADREYLDNFIRNPSIDLNNSSHFNYVKTQMQSGKDFYRRNRDLTVIGIAALHVLSIIDASVDANLFDFDISNDLSMRVEPLPFDFGRSNQAIGINVAINF